MVDTEHKFLWLLGKNHFKTNKQLGYRNGENNVKDEISYKQIYEMWSAMDLIECGPKGRENVRKRLKNLHVRNNL